jgi:hypothetical protein
MKLIPAEFYPPGLLYGFKMKLMTKRPELPGTWPLCRAVPFFNF